MTAAAVVSLAVVAPAAGEPGYSLFNPVPRDRLRPLSTDRPDTTESPYTVDAGHAQVELSFVDYTRDDAGRPGEAETWAVMPTNLKLGLFPSADVQFVIEPYVRTDDADGGGTADGFGVTQVRVKLNLWGNDGGPTAAAVMPFVQFPTASDDALGGGDDVEGGVILPVSIDLTERVGLGLMLEADVVRNADDDGYAVELLHTVAVGVDATDRLGFYAEYIGVAPLAGGEEYRAAAGVGTTFGLTPDVQLDGGVNVGLNDAADDLNIFTGLTVRI